MPAVMAMRRHFPWSRFACLFIVAAAAIAGPKGKADPPDLAEIDRRASDVRREKNPAKKRTALEAVLAAYEARLALRPKDRKLVPRIRRKRASLLKSCGENERALREYERIAAGPSRRKDRARAWREAGELAWRMKRADPARRFLERTRSDYADIVAERAKALLTLGAIHAAAEEHRRAIRCWKDVVERCRDETKAVIEAYDRLALHAIERGEHKTANRWLERCRKRYEKRAARDDSTGRFIARRLGAMKAPAALARRKAR